MPNRVIKESINESMDLSECSLFAIDLYKRLITYADDYGRFNADTTIMRARLYPREYESVTESDILDGLIELDGVNKIMFYSPETFNQFGKKGIYGVFPNWSEHQRMRESKAKCPEPGDTRVNDWYLRRFIPIDLKVEVIERDNYTCQICGKKLFSCTDTKRFIKLGSGLFHIDHIVPVLQGGRATLENLRLTCPSCNLKRKRTLTFKEILAETMKQDEKESEQVATNGGELPQVAASCRNNLQKAARARAESESESESESNPNITTITRTRKAETPFGEVAVDPIIIKVQKELTGLTDTHYDLLAQYRDSLGDELVSLAIDNAVANGVRKWAYVERILQTWQEKGIKTVGEAKAESEKRRQTSGPGKGKVVTAQQFPQRQYDDKTLENEVFGEFLRMAGAK